MNILERLNMKIAEIEAKKPQQPKLRVRVTFSLATGRISWPSQPVKTEQPAATQQMGSGIVQLREEAHQHVNCTCTHCGGSGRYINFKKGTVGKCYRCDGKGVYTEADDAFMRRRMNRNEAISRVAGF